MSITIRQQKGDDAAGLQFRDFEGSTSMPAIQAPASTDRQGREVLTEIGWKFFYFKIPNLIIHNHLPVHSQLCSVWLLGNVVFFQGCFSPHSFSSLLVRLYFARSKGP